MKLVNITKQVSAAIDKDEKRRRLPLTKSTSIRELADADITHAKLNPKTGEYIARKGKAGASHKIIETPGGPGKPSILAAPLGKAPKRPKAPEAAYGPARIPDEAPESSAGWHPAIPEGATWLEYATSTAAILMPISELDALRGFRGKIRFGRLRYNEDFVSMMPGEEGNITRFKDGVTAFAEGKDPATLKAKERSAAAQAERLANPSEHVKEAFAARAAARRVPAGPRPGDKPGLIQNGVRKPGAGGKTARVWEICEQLMKTLGRTPTKPEVLAVSVGKEKASPGMSATQHSYWRRFHNHPK